MPSPGHLCLALGLLLSTNALSADPAPKSPDWQPWSDAVFAQAKREHKFVLLDLHAVWCHWCHVMDETTYRDPKVIALLNAHYITVGVDQDSRPDLANRYEDYGWPATVVFNSDGSEIVKRRGYLPPEQMASMLQAIIDDPTPGPSVQNESKVDFNGTGTLSDAEREVLKKQFLDGYDHKLGSWGTVQKFLNWDNVEYCLVQAKAGDEPAKQMARQTFDAQHKLVDQVWGGVYQYSVAGDWNHPHFEKIMQMQAENMRIYAKAYAQWKDPADLAVATGIYRYVRDFLTSPDGGVYTSQDADLVPGDHSADYFALDNAARRKQGIPRIDTHIYARENGWFIEALTALYAATGVDRCRTKAECAADWIIAHRAIEGGGFQHGEDKSGLICLGDTLAMGRAFLALYAVTADVKWLHRAEDAAGFIALHFPYKEKEKNIGYVTASTESTSYQPHPEFDENVSLARFANLLFHYTANPRDREIAETAMRFVTTPELMHSRFSSVGGLLLADRELATAPLHIAIVGNRKDRVAESLFATAATYPCIYKQVEWFDPHSPAAPVTLIPYPDLPKAAAYLCTGASCSAPVFTSEKLQALLDRKTSPTPAQ